MEDKSIWADQKTKTKNLKVNHPYQQYMDSSLWQIIDKAIDDLVENKDIEETTHRSYIVGYLCKQLAESGKSN